MVSNKVSGSFSFSLIKANATEDMNEASEQVPYYHFGRRTEGVGGRGTFGGTGEGLRGIRWVLWREAH
jgi:hypothetical protein